MEIKELLFMVADLWMIFAGFFYGWKFIRRYQNYLLGLEWMIVATSGTNFLIWSAIKGSEDGLMFKFACFLDAFSRSVGITLILVMGLMRVTHRYKPTLATDIGVFVLATIAGLYFQQFHAHFALGPATYYVVVNVATSLFLIYFAGRLWAVGEKVKTVGTLAATAAGFAIAITYDFFPIPGDDELRTIFYTAALATWGTQLWMYFLGYRALHNHNEAADARPARREQSAAGA
ncbi:hypothetical protein [Nocardia violaceofusca]|uniref:hypothetical protein n=1 Tax=Nocardia violaceofusca TaxID=941182 RepID=UPI0007A38991|nr:hypothetical protein [Nocardia violaceofusca]